MLRSFSHIESTLYYSEDSNKNTKGPNCISGGKQMWLQRVWPRPFSLSFHAPYVREHKTIVIENLDVPPALSLPLEAQAVLSAPRPLPSYCLLCRRSLAPGAFLWLCRSLLRLQKTPWSLWELAGACVPPDGCVPDKYRGLKQWKSNEVVCKY